MLISLSVTSQILGLEYVHNEYFMLDVWVNNHLNNIKVKDKLFVQF